METLVNCDIIVEIHSIEKTIGRDDKFEISFKTVNKKSGKLYLTGVYDVRVAIEEAFRGRQFERKVEENSSVMRVYNSNYIEYFKQQAEGCLLETDLEELKHYIIVDNVESVIEVLAINTPTLIQDDENIDEDKRRESNDNEIKTYMVAGEKNGWNARVLIGKETDRARKHAHVFLKNQMIAAVDISGKVIEGKLNREGKLFVKNFGVDIINGILRWRNYE